MFVPFLLTRALGQQQTAEVRLAVRAPSGQTLEQVAVAVDRMEEGKPSPVLGWQLLPSRPFSLELAPGSYRVRCAAAGFIGKASPPFTLAPGQSVTVECPLAVPVWVAGVVLAQGSGKPVEGAWVGPVAFLPGSCQRLGSEALPCELAAQAGVAKPDRHGSFRLALPPGGEQLLLALAEGFGPGWGKLVPGAAAPPVVLELPPGGSVEGEIHTDEPEGAPRGCAFLRPVFPKRAGEATLALWQLEPEPSGYGFWPAVYPGVWRLGWWPKGCGSEGAAEAGLAASTLVAVRPGERSRAVLEARSRELAVELRGLTAQILWAAQATLSWDCEHGSGLAPLGVVRDGTLARRVRLPVGRCRVSVALETAGEAPWSLEVLTEEVVIAPRGNNAIERELALAELAGTVLGPHSTPVPAKVLVENELYRCTGSFQPGLNLLCPALPKGRYRVLAYADGAAARRQLVAVPGEGLELLLEQGYPVEGRVVGRGGNPVPEAWVRFASLEMADHGFPLGTPGGAQRR